MAGFRAGILAHFLCIPGYGMGGVRTRGSIRAALVAQIREGEHRGCCWQPVHGSCDEEDGQSSAEVTLPLSQQDGSMSLFSMSLFSSPVRLRTVNLGAGAMWVPSADG